MAARDFVSPILEDCISYLLKKLSASGKLSGCWQEILHFMLAIGAYLFLRGLSEKDADTFNVSGSLSATFEAVRRSAIC
jgi:predicted solute-binding protein